MKIEVDKLAVYAEFCRRCAREWIREKREPSPNYYDGMMAGIDLMMEYVMQNFYDKAVENINQEYWRKEDYKND